MELLHWPPGNHPDFLSISDSPFIEGMVFQVDVRLALYLFHLQINLAPFYVIMDSEYEFSFDFISSSIPDRIGFLTVSCGYLRICKNPEQNETIKPAKFSFTLRNDGGYIICADELKLGVDREGDVTAGDNFPAEVWFIKEGSTSSHFRVYRIDTYGEEISWEAEDDELKKQLSNIRTAHGIRSHQFKLN